MPQRKPYGKVSEPIDQWLDLQGLYRKHTARDASCLFRAVAEQLFYTQSCHETVRRHCVEFIQRKRHLYEEMIECSFETYISRMSSVKEWGGQMEMDAMSHLYCRDFLVFQQSGKPPLIATSNGFKETILLCSTSDGHYDSVYSKSYIEKAAFCQSLVYEVLYEDVFKLQDVGYAVEKMLHKSGRNRRDSHVNQISSTGRDSVDAFLPVKPGWRLESDYEGELNVKVLLARGITPFPYKVAKALDPEIYRNIEFDIWSDMRREMRLGMLMGMNNGELQVGVKCIVKLKPDQVYHAHIQEMAPNKGPVIVFVEELGCKCTVPHDVLEPLPRGQRTQWALPYHQQRQLAMSAKTSFLAMQDFGNKCRKSKINKQRKLKEMLMPPVTTQQMQFQANGLQQEESQKDLLGDRYNQEQNSNQLGYHNFPAENMNYTNNMNVPCPPNSPVHSSDGITVTSQADSTTPALSPMGEQEHPQLPTSSSYVNPQPQSPVVSLPSYIFYNNNVQPRVNLHAQKSMQISGSDLPFSDIPTLRFYYNLGLDYLRSGCVLWPNTMIPAPPVSSSSESNGQLMPDSTVTVEEEQSQSRSTHPVTNAGTTWQSQSTVLKEGEHHNGHLVLAAAQEHEYETANIIPNSATHSPVPQMVEPYASTTLIPYYSVEMDSVPYFAMGTPFPYLRPPDVQVPLQPPTVYTPPMTPLVYHQPPPPPPPPPAFTHWIPSPEVLPQYNVAM
ncbi:protein ovarian tumor locus [Anabrus simplex]|uniref:protein ovarian tumor locus n=1 Tax=Anabrus simplex TaxID=316456 RepID=UPI0034DCECC7